MPAPGSGHAGYGAAAMKAALQGLWEQLRTGFWFLPMLMGLAGLGLAAVSLALDQRLPEHVTRPLATVMGGGIEGARQLLATLAGGIITVTGVVFSITMVTLVLAQNQFGSRVIRTFMRDRFVQAVLGTFIATFVFCVVALMDLGPEVPRLTVLLAFLSTATSIGVFVVFLHHVAKAIQADMVARNIAVELEDLIPRLYPEDAASPERPAPAFAATVPAARSGYVRNVDEEALAAAAHRLDVVVRLRVPPGRFVAEGQPLLEVDREVDQEAARALRRHAGLGAARTPEQDVEFNLEQLTEVAVRALSPGIQDPFTAVGCVDRLGGLLCRLAARHPPSPYVEHEGRLRLVVPRRGFEEVLDAALDPLRQAAGDSVPVLTRLLEMLAVVASCTEDPRRREALRRHAGLVLDAARRGGHQAEDLEDVAVRHRRVMAATA